MITKNQIKLINSLNLKKNRKKYGLFVVEGEKLVDELLQSDWPIESIFATKDWSGQADVLLSENELKRISFLKTPNKVLALVKIKTKTNFKLANTVLALDDIKDPGNLGTIIRIADWFGVQDILCSEETVDYLNPKVIQSTMGSFCRVNLSYVDLSKTLQTLTDFDIFTTVMDGEPVECLKQSSNKIIVLGNESKGISENLLQLNSKKISIKKASVSKAESLNVAVACGICLSVI